ncbi:MAG: NUDIX domain-containing protein [Bacteroidales bacterium]|nr:NUDIX domain-containing protein [Bacteroidales bacterium]
MFIEEKKYSKIKRLLPLNAVEILILDSKKRVLMVKRNNEPALNKWWIPGGRVLFGEKRIEAAQRLLKTECDITHFDIDELETVEYLVENKTENYYQHVISKIYIANIKQDGIQLDSQSSEHLWKYPNDWTKLIDHKFILNLLNNYQRQLETSFFSNYLRNNEGQKIIDPELYQTILQTLSIPCVDIFVTNTEGKVLLVKRKNEPAKGEWWVPGGRVLYGERMIETAQRKLWQECGLGGNNFIKFGDFDFVFNNKNDQIFHDIGTLFEVIVNNNNKDVILDSQSSMFKWKKPLDWLKEDLHDFIRDVLLYKMKKGKVKKSYN